MGISWGPGFSVALLPTALREGSEVFVNGRRIFAGAAVLPAVLSMHWLYRYGGWSLGPASPADLDACAMGGGREGDLFLLHHCAPDPFAGSRTR